MNERKKNIKLRWKSSLLVMAYLLVYLHLFIHVAYTRTQIVTTQNTFDLILSSGSFTIQNEQEFVTFSVESGTLNGSSANLNVDTGVGHLLFHAEDSCTLTMELITDRTISVIVNGASITSTSDTTFQITITASSDVEISWGYNLESYADKYTVLAFGIIGICMMVFGPVWAIRKVLSEGLEVETVERVGYAILIFMIGLGLFITFLYW